MHRDYDAIVLAGGQARRMDGADKPSVAIGGTPMLDRVLAAVASASRRVVVGPHRVLPPNVLRTSERPAGGGPLAATAAGLAFVGADTVLVLAADLPWIAPAVGALLTELEVSGAGAVALADDTGRLDLLASAWRRGALSAALDAIGSPAGLAMRDLHAHADIRGLGDPDGWGGDCDTWADVAAARTVSACESTRAGRPR